MKKKTLKIALSALGTTSAALLYSSIYFYKQAVKNKRSTVPLDYDLINVVPNDPWEKEKIWFQKVERNTLTIQSQDNLTLKAMLVEHEKANKKVAILAHGYSGTSKEMAPFAKLFYDLGFTIVLPDARGHGDSEGDYIGFGWPERHDYLAWIDSLINRYGQDTEIVLFGVSMGGATVLNVSGEILPDQVKAIVEDCGYSSVEKELSYQLKNLYKLPSYPIIPMTSLLTKYKAGYSFTEASPVDQVKKSSTPTLFIHGDKDSFVPTDMAYELYQAAASDKALYIVPGAEHAYSYVTDKDEYRRQVARFFSRYLNHTIS
ncbi:hypothetical protein SAMN05421839_1171 [Halolactibacillus halophilus]|uniref:Alpha/beta hydrolase n=1 Tax=Halolactibacillus halophilus TaxID=306540 RepID=A0A1I5PW33_9BACI|nr:alpha/beta hydrolase [Halolactibacillus halophilus]GEM02218.1 alpha/beta hydrolase [Halolactibacillus halophilus]SFP38040.1 hypothetical protein SAMN05421839_1171 [Halolactibacillus halophilus]